MRKGSSPTSRNAKATPNVPPPPANSIPIVVERNQSRRQFVSGNHLLNFEVTSSPSAASYGSPRRPRQGPRPGATFTKERFIHANFRFVARDDMVPNKTVFSTDPDARLDWSDIELVIVPAQQDASCPICLDTPLAPRLTKCGHFFCWPCILRYAAATSEAGSGNWRKCPICFESISTRQLKSVYFKEVSDFGGRFTAEITKIGIPMILLAGHSGSNRIYPAERGPEYTSPKGLEDLSPFEKVSFVDQPFVVDCIIGREARELGDRLAEMDDDDPSRVYIELALTMVEDRRQGTEDTVPSPELISASSTETTSPTGSNTPIFFHQSLDGQPFFLSPFSIKILRREFSSYSALPPFICAPVLEIEMSVMTEELRRRYRYLHHLPIGCQFGLCEVDLSSIVSPAIFAEFFGEIAAKAEHRRAKAARETKRAAAAERREQQRANTYDFDLDDRSISPAPGVATGIFMQDYENFPLPTGEDDVSGPVPIDAKPAAPVKPLAGSFASVAAISSTDAFLVVGSVPSSSLLATEMSFEDISMAPSSDGSTKKSKRVVLVSNAHRRAS